MRIWLTLVFILAVAMPGFAAIQSADVSSVIAKDLSVAETITAVFDAPLNGTVDYALNEQVTGIEVRDSDSVLAHELVQVNGNYVLKIETEGDNTLAIKFVSKELVFQNNDIFQFFTELSFAEPVSRLTVKVILPEGYGIYQNSYRPNNATITTNGRNIELAWTFSGFSSAEIFSVKFEQLGRETNIWIAVAIIALLVLVYFLKHYQKKMREKEAKARLEQKQYQKKLQEKEEKARQEFLMGFREDEKKVIEYMQKHGTAYQNKIEHEFKFSRAKMTRIVQKLVEKGLLHKKRKGRTNRLTWIKK